MNDTGRQSFVSSDILFGKKIKLEFLGETPDHVVRTLFFDNPEDVTLWLAIKDSRHIEQSMLPRKRDIYNQEQYLKGKEADRYEFGFGSYLQEGIENKYDFQEYDFVEYAGEKNGEIFNTIRDSIYSFCGNKIQCFFPRIFIKVRLNKKEIEKNKEASVSEISSLITKLNSLVEEDDCIMPVYNCEDVQELLC